MLMYAYISINDGALKVQLFLISKLISYTLVSGPDGPLTRRYAPTSNPRRDHSDRAQRLYHG